MYSRPGQQSFCYGLYIYLIPYMCHELPLSANTIYKRHESYLPVTTAARDVAQ